MNKKIIGVFFIGGILILFQALPFPFKLIPRADVRIGIHQLHTTSVCKGIILPISRHGLCVGLTGHFWE